MDQIRRLANQIRLTVSRAVLEFLQDHILMQVTMLEGEPRDDVEHMQPFGLLAKPLRGAEGVFLSAGGDRDHGLVVCMTNREAIPSDLVAAIQEGETALWAAGGWYMHLKRDGTLRINVRAVEVLAPDGTSFDHDVAIGQRLDVVQGGAFGEDVLVDGLSVGTHVHDGVERGEGVSNPPVKAPIGAAHG
ncbi:phage baseplate assembly protein domain-containing protein [Burkholderia cenocepacia]|uniref:phage baseplate assembly protein domain-containing protein n=1 Tax=Burkholderia cenocepacia TaxID=95486 RepID=UPI001B9C0A1D|nr:phage baseplate assembly protein [Burkholderia cenocepacia]MBR8137181.1 phage baseplate assembly protein [Burkholderia cenocepacia]